MPEAPVSSIHKAYRYEIKPTAAQIQALESHIGGARFAYNTLLEEICQNWAACRRRKEAGEDVPKEGYLGTSQLDIQRLWYAKRTEWAPWYGVNGSSSYNYAHVQLSKAFTNKKKGRAKFPTKKKKGPSGSVTLAGGAVGLFDSTHIKLSRIGTIRTYESTRKLYRHVNRGTGVIKYATISKVRGRWYVSFTVAIKAQLPETRPPEKIIGIDVGLSTLYTGVSPDGEHVLSVENTKHYKKFEAKLRKAQRQASRKLGPAPGRAQSNRWKKANKKTQKIHADIKNARLNRIHETTTHLAKTYDVIVVEDLNIAGMVKNKKLAKHIQDAAWGEFIRQLEYKCVWYGATLIKVDRFYPSSKKCSNCDTVKTKLDLSERV